MLAQPEWPCPAYYPYSRVPSLRLSKYSQMLSSCLLPTGYSVSSLSGWQKTLELWLEVCLGGSESVPVTILWWWSKWRGRCRWHHASIARQLRQLQAFTGREQFHRVELCNFSEAGSCPAWLRLALSQAEDRDWLRLSGIEANFFFSLVPSRESSSLLTLSPPLILKLSTSSSTR